MLEYDDGKRIAKAVDGGEGNHQRLNRHTFDPVEAEVSVFM